MTHFEVMRLCRRLGGADPAVARRVAAAQRGPAERAIAWGYVGLGLVEKDKAGALEAVDQAIREIDQLRQSGPGPESIPRLGGVTIMYPTNPAVLLLPVVERTAPERLDDVFWRAVALHPRLQSKNQLELQTSYVGYECIVLARYDRAVTGVLFSQIDRYLHSLTAGSGPKNLFVSHHLTAKGCIEPRAALQLINSLSPPGPFDPPLREVSRENPAYAARVTLARALGLPAEKRWAYLWRRMGSHLCTED